MDTNLFTERSIWTMVHGIVLGGGALLGLSAALFALATAGVPLTAGAPDDDLLRRGRAIGRLTTFVAVALWLTVLVGTYVSFPPYRATPPEGLTDLARYPRSLLLANPGTAWLHSFAMEIKEHVPWIAAMLATAAAFVTMREPARVLVDASLRRMTTTMLSICFAIVAAISLLGVFINKVAPLD